MIAGLSFEAPIIVRPGEAVNCQVTPATALGGSGEVAVLFNFDRVASGPMQTQFGKRLWIRRGCQSSPEP